MKNIILTVMLLGLLAGVSFAQRGRSPMGTNRGMTQMGPISHTNPIGPTPQIVRPNAIQMGPTAHRPSATSPGPSAARPTTSVGNDHRSVAPPDAVVGPNVSNRVPQQ